VVSFDNLNVFDAANRPGDGVYRLNVMLVKTAGATEGKSSATLTIEGATECALREGFKVIGEVRELAFPAGAKSFHLRAVAPTIRVKLEYDEQRLTVTELRLMQGSNRPWREVSRAALDGEIVIGRREGGLQFADGGGITLNHPTRSRKEYEARSRFLRSRTQRLDIA
jgi:hypothetical protein